uniref:Class I SAM-dependent methyltransferase n=1 Tax=Romanomermis culicivorax TaxID=13658 RepID=A0A915JL86_ROMCU
MSKKIFRASSDSAQYAYYNSLTRDKDVVVATHMTTPAACLTSLLNFELQFHKEVLKWIEWKLSNGSTPIKDMELLDVSDDHCVFSFLLLKYLKAKRLVAAVRGNQATDLIDRSVEIRKFPDLSENNLQNLSSLGRFDVIIIKDTTHETENLSAFFLTLKNLLKNDDGRIFILAHPKNPPLPIPDVAVPFWRRSAPNREEIIKSIKSVSIK